VTIRRAGRVLLVAALLGMVGQLLLFDVALGLNFPILIALLVLAGWLLRVGRRGPEAIDRWLGPAAVCFAAFAAVRADTTIVALDVLGALGLTGAALASFGLRPVMRRSLPGLLRLGATTAGWVAAGAVPVVGIARRRLPAGTTALGRARPAMPVVRGLLIAVPLVIVFMSLFSAADAVFARLVDDLVSVELDLGTIPGRALLTLVLAWVAAGALALAAGRPQRGPVGTPTPSGPMWRLGTTEAVTVLLAVDLLFVAFVILQGAYLFGGRDTMAATGLSYSEYARRGFFELVAVAVLAGGTIVAFERAARQRSRVLIGAALGLTVLTAVVLVSAALRLQLYQEAYGWTELRLYVIATIGLLAAVLAGLAVALLTDRVRWIGHIVMVAGLVIGLGLNFIGPARFITEQNVARALDPALVPEHGWSGLDTIYAISLGDDRIPDLVRVLPALDAEEAAFLRDELRHRLSQLRTDPGLTAWQAWNLGRERARAALEDAEARGQLD